VSAFIYKNAPKFAITHATANSSPAAGERNMTAQHTRIAASTRARLIQFSRHHIVGGKVESPLAAQVAHLYLAERGVGRHPVTHEGVEVIAQTGQAGVGMVGQEQADAGVVYRRRVGEVGLRLVGRRRCEEESPQIGR
jgi:hypothetical protein